VSHHIAPSFLAAPPSLIDSIFKNAVIAVAMHQEEGAMGFVISRQTELSFHELLEDLAIKPKVADRTVLYGGPVSKNSGFLLYEHEPNIPLTPGLILCDTISITPSRELLDKAAAGKLPGRFELILGYAGWGPGQLELELCGGGWLNTPFYPEIMFDVPVSERWNHTYSQVGVSPYAFMNVPGGAQA
jgi:putative transcriptional regulator